ncbi:class I SAM-dependent methyltransferase [Mesorhizobium sp. M00.F.Ca.ET.186.01.1.1]|nr:class I SAM-dependent methyltransferase [Mesorhizobium sp. M00.F.Ca.ET.186.01.1.1]
MEELKMGWSKEWEDTYRTGSHLSIWPWSDMVSYVMRYCRPFPPGFKVLELGCGAGANIPFFLKMDIDYYAIEGSATIVERLIDTYPSLESKIAVGDFTKEIPFEEQFDLVIDRASLTTNRTKDITASIDILKTKMKANAKFIGIDWYSTDHSEFQKGEQAEDFYTRAGYKTGEFADIGRVHFSDKEHLLQLFSSFEIVLMEQKLIKKEVPADEKVSATWNFVAELKETIEKGVSV